MRKIILISGVIMLVAAIVLFRKQTKAQVLKNEKEQFSFIEKMNNKLFEKLPDSIIFQISGLKYTMNYEKKEYGSIVGKQTLKDVYAAIKSKKIYEVYVKTDRYDLYVESDDYAIYTISSEPLPIKDHRVTEYVYFKEGSLTKRKFRDMESVDKFEKFEKIKDQWYKVVFIKNSGRNLNL